MASAAERAAGPAARGQRLLRHGQRRCGPDQPGRSAVWLAGRSSRARRIVGTDAAAGDPRGSVRDGDWCAAARLRQVEVCQRPRKRRVLVRSIWRAEVTLRSWAPEHEIPFRRTVPASDLAGQLWMEPGAEPIYARAAREAGLALAVWSSSGERPPARPVRAAYMRATGARPRRPRRRSCAVRHWSRNGTPLDRPDLR